MRNKLLIITCCCAIVLSAGSCGTLGGLFFPGELRSLREEISHLREEKRVLNMRVNELQQDRFTLLALGDILLANEIDSALRRGGLGYPFEKIKEETARYDLVFANLEMPITLRGEPVREKPYTFRLDPLNALSLLDLGLSAVSLANNHIMDYGQEGMLDTMAFLREYSILHTGSGRNIQEARTPAELQHGITRVIILAYCERPPFEYYADADSPGIALLDAKAVAADIKKFRSRNNVVLISLHWGIEQTSMPKYYQRMLAHKIIDAGADGIIGHHPHWPQAVEMYKNRPVIYSLGNFINGFYNNKEQDNLMAALYFDRNVLERVELIPLAGKNSEIGFQPHVMTGKAAVNHLREIQAMSRQLGTVVSIEKERGVLLPR